MRIDYQELLAQVIVDNPELGANGWRLPRTPDAKHERDRVSLQSRIQEFREAYGWCGQLVSKKHPLLHPLGNSYTLKHICERANGHYVTNGTFIAAMLARGFTYQREPYSLNCYFAVTKRSVRLAQELKRNK